MARIKQIKPTEEKMLISIAKGGGLNYDQMRRLEIPPQRVFDYIKDGYLVKERETFKTQDGEKETRTWYRLGNAGRDYLQQNGYCQAFAKAQSYEHCTDVGWRIYQYLDQGVSPQQVLNENEIKIHYPEWKQVFKDCKEQGIKLSCPDIVVITQEEMQTETEHIQEVVEVLEVTTSNYDKNEIKAKQEFIERVIAKQSTVAKVSFERSQVEQDSNNY